MKKYDYTKIKYEDTNTIFALLKKVGGRNVLQTVAPTCDKLNIIINARCEQLNAHNWVCAPETGTLTSTLKDEAGSILEEYIIKIIGV